MNKSSINIPDSEVPIPSRNTNIYVRACVSAYRLFSGIVVATMLLSPSALLSLSPIVSVPASTDTAGTETTHNIFSIPSAPDHWDPTLAAIMNHEVYRLGITNRNWVNHVEQYIDMLNQIESSGNQYAYNKSGAMSYFQFKPMSVKTAYVRLINYLSRHDLGRSPQWAKHLSANPFEMYHTDIEKQTVLLLINIIEQDYENDTNYFAQFLTGDSTAGVTAYYKYHHTKPDAATIKITEHWYKVYFK